MFFRLGEALAAQKRHEEALACFRAVLRMAPESPHTAAQMDAVYDELNAPKARLREWQALVEMHPESPTLQKHLTQAEAMCQGVD